MYKNLGLDNTEEEKCRVLCFGSLVPLIQAALGALYVRADSFTVFLPLASPIGAKRRFPSL